MDAPVKKSAANKSQASATERRRVLAAVVHDERGNASAVWEDAPAGEARPVLEVLGERSLALVQEDAFDPYAQRKTRKGNGAPRTDLHRLSEWIKAMRELEARKRREHGADDQD